MFQTEALKGGQRIPDHLASPPADVTVAEADDEFLLAFIEAHHLGERPEGLGEYRPGLMRGRPIART